METGRESKRAHELRQTLGQEFSLPPEVVSAAIVAFVASVQDRLPAAVSVAVQSWVPECRALPAVTPVRGTRALRERVAAAGVPDDIALEFVTAFVRFLGDRCGTSIADAIRRKLPEVTAAEQQTALVAELFDLSRP